MDITLEKIDEVHLKVHAERSIIQELADRLTFEVPGAKFQPSFKARFWDGKITLINRKNCYVYVGLEAEIIKFAQDFGYSIQPLNSDKEILSEKILGYLKTLTKHEPRDYQISTLTACVESNRGVFLSPTGSGKSMIIYLLCRYLLGQGRRILIVVPTTALVYQMQSDFEDYNTGNPLNTACIVGGLEKTNSVDITISTWQSIYKLPKSWFSNFDAIIGDEVHLFTSKSLTDIMLKLTECKYRYGFTGTLAESKTNKLVLEGLFGPVHQVVTTADLIERGVLAQLSIDILLFKYPDEERKIVSKYDYDTERDYITKHDKRNTALAKLAKSLKGNSMFLYRNIAHGESLYAAISKACPDKKIFLINGDVDISEREDVRKAAELSNDVIIIASYGTFSTGTNIVNLLYVVFASPYKSKIKVLQSLGRGLRKGGDKTHVKLFDIADDFSWKKKLNITLHHLMERTKIYDLEKLPYKVHPYTVL